MPDLFDYQDKYPQKPGHKRSGTSKEAAQIIAPKEKTLREQVLDMIKATGPMTPDECAGKMGKTVLSIRPRFSELALNGLIIETGERRSNSSGLKANVYKAVEAEV